MLTLAALAAAIVLPGAALLVAQHLVLLRNMPENRDDPWCVFYLH